MHRSTVVAIALLLGVAWVLVSREPQIDPRLRHAFRQPARNGWIFVHLEGPPSTLGYQHGYLLAPEIQDNLKALSVELTHEEHKDWQFFRTAARDVLWPHIEPEYREELQGITDGVNARGVKADVWDVVALNAWLEMDYYVRWYDKEHKIASPPSATAPEHCSAFVATGSYTRDGRVVMGHNAWTSYSSGERWNVIFDLAPAKGRRMLMDGMPGLIHSGDDFGLNDAGILITETTISRFRGWDSAGIAEFVRARKAMQYSESIDDFARIMREGNNGGYANDWLVADRKTNEIASLELGLKNVNLERSRDGYFVGSNFPINAQLATEETDFDVNDMGQSANARHLRWREVMEENKGRIDVEAAHRFLADHFDTYEKKVNPGERSLCGHIDLSPRGSQPWQPPYGVAGAVQSKATDTALAERMTLTAALGHACGIDFHAAEHLRKHPEFAWQKEVLRDMPARPWTTFSAK
jgi:hypothetical protein